jgi:Transposase DDE domain
MLQFYHSHLQSSLNKSEFLIFKILIDLLQIHQWVRLESLADKFPLPIEFHSRRKKLQRFLSSKKLNIQTLWHPILKQIIATYYPLEKPVYLVIDRTRWANVNILMISLLSKKRAIPIYFELLEKKGNSSVKEQITALSIAISLFDKYHKIVLGDREFCGVDLAKWLSEQEKTDFCLRTKKNVYLELNEETKSLQELGLLPGMSVYYQGIKLTKSKGFSPINLAAKWKKTYRNKKTKEPWFIMTSLGNLQEATTAYFQRMGIEEMFRDFKRGGYNLESTGLRNERLLVLVLLITFAYVEATFEGDTLATKGSY